MMALPAFLRNVTKLCSCNGVVMSSSLLCARYHCGYQPLNERKTYQTRLDAQNLLRAVEGRSCLVGLQQVQGFSTSPQRLASHDHAKMWSVEKAVTVALLGVVPLALAFPSQVLDCVLATTLVMHNHWGIESSVADYVRPIVLGPVLPKIAVMAVYGVSIVTLAGLFYFIFNDVGIANGIRMLWRL